mmetsp:Transcript_2928/g.10445  ORF Transcript_2928/g.10445 Transcript_2928/m.10445 type:complete len:244 (-) Transcript_2928:1911-2642(-)
MTTAASRRRCGWRSAPSTGHRIRCRRRGPDRRLLVLPRDGRATAVLGRGAACRTARRRGAGGPRRWVVRATTRRQACDVGTARAAPSDSQPRARAGCHTPSTTASRRGSSSSASTRPTGPAASPTSPASASTRTARCREFPRHPVSSSCAGEPRAPDRALGRRRHSRPAVPEVAARRHSGSTARIARRRWACDDRRPLQGRRARVAASRVHVEGSNSACCTAQVAKTILTVHFHDNNTRRATL